MSIDLSNLDRSSHSFMMECCERLHLPELYASQAKYKFDKMHASEKKSLGLSVKTESDAEAAFSYLLYSIFMAEGCLVSIDEMCSATGCLRKRLWKIVRQDKKLNSITVKPAQMLTRYINLFEVTKEDKLVIRRKCSELASFFGHSPKTIIAYSIYFTIRENAKPKRKYTLKEICAEIGITPTCIFRLRRIVQKVQK